MLIVQSGEEDNRVCETNEAAPAGSLPYGEADPGRGGRHDWEEGGEEEASWRAFSQVSS